MADTPKPDAAPVQTGAPIFDRYDARVVQALAIGSPTEDDLTILTQAGLSDADAQRLLDDPIFKSEVAALTQELRRAGTMAKVKARFVAEELIGKLWIKAKESHRSVAEMLDMLKVLAKIGDLEPRETGGKLTGTIVRVDLNFGSFGFNPPQRTTINVEAQADQATDVESDDSGFPGLATQTVDLTEVAHAGDLPIPGSRPVAFLGWEITDDLEHLSRAVETTP